MLILRSLGNITKNRVSKSPYYYPQCIALNVASLRENKFFVLSEVQPISTPKEQKESLTQRRNDAT